MDLETIYFSLLPLVVVIVLELSLAGIKRDIREIKQKLNKREGHEEVIE